MIKRKCPQCKEYIFFADAENTAGTVFYNKQYYHKDCFVITCNKKLKSKKEQRLDWGKALNEIPKLQQNAKKKIKVLVERDNFYNFALENYQMSSISDRMWGKLAHIYDGTYEGLAYAIGPEELLEEWKFFMPELVQNREIKNIFGPSAFAYDLAIVLNRNAEYRELMERRKVEEQVREAQKSAEVEIDMSAIHTTTVSRGNRRLADLYDDFMGGDE